MVDEDEIYNDFEDIDNINDNNNNKNNNDYNNNNNNNDYNNNDNNNINNKIYDYNNNNNINNNNVNINDYNINNNNLENQNNQNYEINNNLNNNTSSNKNTNTEIKNDTNSFKLFRDYPQSQPSSINEKEENTILIEKANLEREKQKFYNERKAQSDELQKYIELISSLSAKKELDFPFKFKNEESKLELNNLIIYNSKINEIESEERILDQDINYFEQYKTSFARIYEEKQKDLEKLKLEYEQEKNELDRKLELLEIEEKMINDKYNNFEKEKNILTERYNNVLKKEASLNVSKMRIENNLRELDRRNLILEKNNQMINENKKEIESEINKNMFELKRIYEEKNNLKLRQEMIDSIRMKYVGDLTNNPFDYTQKPNFKNNENDKFLDIKNEYKNISTIRQNTFYKAGQFKNNENENEYININKNIVDDSINIKPEKYLLKNYNNEQNDIPQKLSIINEEENNIKNSSNNNY